MRLRTAQDVAAAAARMGGDTFLLEDMVEDGVAELLVGIVKDPAHGFVLTVGAGGMMTELLQDSASVLVPSSRAKLEQALNQLKMAPVLDGYRNQPAANRTAILDAIEALQQFVIDHAETIVEVEVNPLIATPTRAIAADALIRKSHD